MTDWTAVKMEMPEPERVANIQILPLIKLEICPLRTLSTAAIRSHLIYSSLHGGVDAVGGRCVYFELGMFTL